MLRTVARIVALLLGGALVATAGVGAHRALGYWGLALAILCVATAGVFARAWGRWAGYLAYAAGWFVMTMVYAQRGSGNSVLIAGDAYGYGWLLGGSVVISALAFIPRSLLEGRDVAA